MIELLMHTLLMHYRPLCVSHFCRETTEENYQFSNWETWIFNAILDRKIKLLCRFVNFEKMKKEIYKMIF